MALELLRTVITRNMTALDRVDTYNCIKHFFVRAGLPKDLQLKKKCFCLMNFVDI